MEKSLRPKTDKDFGPPPPGYVAGSLRGDTGFASGVSRDTRVRQEKEKDLGDSNYDKFAGYSESLFQSGSYDKEDDEADRIYDMIETRMESRKKKSRTQHNQPARNEVDIVDLQSQFSSAKTDLLNVSEEQWMHLPVAQERLKAKRPQKEFLTSAPDSLITTGGPPGMMEIGEAKKAVLEVSLNAESSGLGVDPQQYLEQLSAKQTDIADIAEVKKARLLFKSITKTDPNNPTGWLAAARLEEVSGSPDDAKAVVAKGLSHCPTSEDLWLAAVRLEQNAEKSKSVVANALKQIPRSVKLWEVAAGMESKPELRTRVIQKGLELVPDSIELWKTLVNLTSGRPEALLILNRAVECCPSSEELWLTYARLSEPQAAQKILNDARKALPTSVAVWVSAAELVERLGAADHVIENIFVKAVESLAKNGVVRDKISWLETAATSSPQFKQVPRAITKIVVRGWILKSLESKTPKEVKHEVFRDVESVADTHVKLAILTTAVHDTPLHLRKGVWIKLIRFMQDEKIEGVGATFNASIQACPHSEVLWLMFAKYLWGDLGDIDSARLTLEKAAAAIDDSENIYIAAARIEESLQTSEGINACRAILIKARARCPKSSRLWIKSAQIERMTRSVEAVIDICQDGLGRVGSKSGDAFKLHLIPVHALMESDRLEEAALFIGKACESFPTKSPVWLVAADIAMSQGDWNRARAILERGRIRLPHDEHLWWKGFLVEQQTHGPQSPAVKVFLSRALQACPSSGLLWSCAITAEPAVTRHPKCLDALKRCPTEGLVVASVAKFFWLEKLQIDKARKWFENAIISSPNSGQVWAEYLTFEISQGEENLFNVEHVVAQLSHKQPGSINNGIEWNMYRKSIENWNKPLMELIIGFSTARFGYVYEKIGARISAVLLESRRSVKSE